MATVGAVCGRALRLIGVQDPTEAISADNFSTAVQALNAMLARWQANGLSLGWTPVANPSDAMPTPASDDEAITYNLAALLAPEYRQDTPNEVVLGLAKEGLASLWRDRLEDATLTRTAGGIVLRALRLLGVIGTGPMPNNVDISTGLRALNDMVNDWQSSGLVLAWANVATPADALPSPAYADEPMTYNLALRIAPEYQSPPSEAVAAIAQSGMATLWRARLQDTTLTHTVAGVVLRALRLLNVIGEAKIANNIDLSTGIRALNAMVGRWEANGLALGWQPVAALTDLLPAPTEADDAITYNLALRLAPEYAAQPSPVVVQSASECLADLRRDVVVNNPIKYTHTSAPAGFSRAGRWNIYTDGPVW